MSDLGELLRAGPDTSLQIVYGVVASVSPSLTVTVGPSTTAVAVAPLRGSGVRVGDKVAVLQQGADRLLIGISDGASLPWTTGVAGTVLFSGSGANVSSSRRHRLVGDMVEVEYGWALTGAPTAGLMVLTVPFSPVGRDGAGNSIPLIGWASAVDQGTGHYIGHQVYYDTATGFAVGLTPAQTNWSSTVPMAWANTDFGTAYLRYRI